MEIEEFAKISIPILVVAFFGSIIPRKLKEREKFLEAANKFREAFTEEIRFIDRYFAVDRAGRDIPEVLAAAADKHELALIAFMEVLGKRKKAKIKEAWQVYTGDDKLMGKPTFRQYANDGIKNRIKGNDKIALKRINYILQFAKHK